ncbi:MAG: exosome complex protein Rrp42 [archaeon]
MTTDLLAPIMRENVLRLLNDNLRMDGRKADEFRVIELQAPILDKPSGSALVKMGKTTVMAGVQIELGTPYPDTPDEGALSVNSEFLPLADPEFEGGRPSDESIELSRVVDRGIRESKAIDMSKLVIESGKHVWMVYVDLWVLDSDGSLIDAAGIAALAALMNAKVKSAKVVGDKVEVGEDSKPLPLKDHPVPCTVIKVGDKLVLDSTRAEEQGMDCRITVTTRADGAICAMQKGLAGSFTQEEIAKAIDYSVERGKQVRKLLKIK